MVANAIEGLHHIMLCTGSAQGDIDFFVKVLGQRFIKRTLFYDGNTPIYHLYFTDELGTPGTVMTTFPMKRTGIVGRKGSGQFTAIAYSVPIGSLDFWREQFGRNGIKALAEAERFGDRYIRVEHAGIEFEVVEDPSDMRKPFRSQYVPEQFAARGFHNWTFMVRERDNMASFLEQAWNFKLLAEDGAYSRFEVKGGGAARIVDMLHAPEVSQGSWTLGAGTVHHAAFAVPDYDTQDRLKFEVEGMGYTDFSDRKHRGYFESIYVRTPGGPLFEATKSLGFTTDEPLETLGTDFKISPQFESRKAEIIKSMNDPIVI